MAKFLVLYRSPLSARAQMANATPEQAEAGMQAWQVWAQQAGSAIVDLGAPLNADGDVTGFSILQADSCLPITRTDTCPARRSTYSSSRPLPDREASRTTAGVRLQRLVDGMKEANEARRSGPRSHCGLLYGTVATNASLASVARSPAMPKNGWNTLPFMVMPS
jgi:hypothetical protein